MRNPHHVWVVCEIWDFGTMSTLIAGMTETDQDAIASKYGISNGRILASWLRSLNYLRNVCAHHSRLWNRNIVDQPKLPRVGEVSLIEPFRGKEHCLARAKHVPLVKSGYVRHTSDGIYGIDASNQNCAYSMPSAPDFDCLGNQGHFAVCFSAIAVYVTVGNRVLNNKIDGGIEDAVEKYCYMLRNVGFP